MKERKPARHGFNWYIHEINQLRSEVNQRMSVGQIAVIHGRTEVAIAMAMEKYKIFVPKPPRLIINGVDYDRKIELAKLVVQSVIDGNHRFIRVGDEIFKKVI